MIYEIYGTGHSRPPGLTCRLHSCCGTNGKLGISIATSL